MRIEDIAGVAAEGLWRARLRAALATTGVVVGTGAMVSMLSFSHGMQQQVRGEMRAMGLLETLLVRPRRGAEGGDPRPLDRAAEAEIKAIEGVTAVLPMTSLEADATLLTHSRRATVHGLPPELIEGGSMITLRLGAGLSSDDAREAIVSAAWLEQLGVSDEDALGEELEIRTSGRGALAVRMVVNQLARLGLTGRPLESVRGALQALAERILPSRARLRVIAIADLRRGPTPGRADIVVPIGVAGALDHLPFSNPVELLAAIEAPPGTGWRTISVKLASQSDADRVTEAIEALGFGVFNFAAQFREMRRFFLFFDGLLAAIGLMALSIAALGIANTMLMAILERRREIGVLMSLGARDREVRLLFLTETSLIGLAGGLVGVLLGWLVSRALALAVAWWMERQGVPPMDPFSLTPAIAAGAVALAVAVSVAAGLIPAARAARIDPVRALRAE